MRITKTARQIASVAYSDSRVELDVQKLARLLVDDSFLADRLPTDAECVELVCGGQDGEIPERLVADFPQVHAYLASFF